MNTFSDLTAFVDLAEKNRKYPKNTAQGHRAALKVFGKELKQDEFNSLKIIEERLDEIFLEVLNSNKDKFSIDSINTYKMRFLKVISDYKRYGLNPSQMQNWQVKPRRVILSKPELKDVPDVFQDASDIKPSGVTHNSVSNVDNYVTGNVHRIELALRPNQKAILHIPSDITKTEAETLKSIIDSLAINE